MADSYGVEIKDSSGDVVLDMDTPAVRFVKTESVSGSSGSFLVAGARNQTLVLSVRTINSVQAQYAIPKFTASNQGSNLKVSWSWNLWQDQIGLVSGHSTLHVDVGVIPL